jgi:hypothetical protein
MRVVDVCTRAAATRAAKAFGSAQQSRAFCTALAAWARGVDALSALKRLVQNFALLAATAPVMRLHYPAPHGAATTFTPGRGWMCGDDFSVHVRRRYQECIHSQTLCVFRFPDLF